MNTANRKIAEIVSENIKTAHVFKKYGIDFCCGGGITIEKACLNKKINPNDVLRDLNALDKDKPASQNPNNWDLEFLIDYIVNTHHRYVTESLDIIKSYAEKVAKVHGESHPPVIEILQLFRALSNELTAHMIKEEKILFPHIKKLVQAKKSGTATESAPAFNIQNPIQVMEHEHETAGNLLKEIAVLSNNYTPPEWACNTFKALYEKLSEFEQDLHIHIHLENNILFPKSVLIQNPL